MEPDCLRLETGRARRIRSEPDQQLQPDQLSRKRRCGVKDEDISSRSHRQSAGIQGSLQKPRASSHCAGEKLALLERRSPPSIYSASRTKADLIENWLSASSLSQRASVKRGSLLQKLSEDMPHKVAEDPPSRCESSNSTTPSSAKTKITAASVTDVGYRVSLGFRNIYIGRSDPPTELMWRATEVISQPQAPLGQDEVIIQKLRDKLRGMENGTEGTITQHISPVIGEIPDRRLLSAVSQLWSNAVPVPLDPEVYMAPPPLPRPKPDLAFGYSDIAFTKGQLTTIEHLIVDQSGQSYAVPDRTLRFPFLSIEFKSQAKGGTHYVAANQVAGAGAIVLNSFLELLDRGFGEQRTFDSNEPLFFSFTLDDACAQIYVHWASTAPAKGGRPSRRFDVERLAGHWLGDAAGWRAVLRVVRNILHYALSERLPRLRAALDAYQASFLAERATATGLLAG